MMCVFGLVFSFRSLLFLRGDLSIVAFREFFWKERGSIRSFFFEYFIFVGYLFFYFCIRIGIRSLV